MKRASFLFFLVLLSALVFLAGCVATSPTPDWQPLAPQKKFPVHVVQWPGETLPMIAQWYTGQKENWEALANANPNIAPERLSPGDRILLPPQLVKTEKKMPREFISSFAGKARAGSRKTPGKAKPGPEGEEEFQLYGPK